MELIDAVKGWFLNMGGALASRLVGAALTAVLGCLAIRLVNGLVNRALEKSKLERAAHSLIKSLIRVVMIAVLVLIVASALGIDVTGLVALASVATLAVSLALQNALTNVIGGFTLLYTKPFHSGDFVEVAGQSGTVKEIGMAYTRLVTADNKLVSIPNSTVVANQIVNYTSQGLRRVDVAVSASYDTPIPKVLEALKKAAELEWTLADPAPEAVVTNYGDSAIGYSLRFWVQCDHYWDAYFAANQRVAETFAENGVEMTYPHLKVHIENK